MDDKTLADLKSTLKRLTEKLSRSQALNPTIHSNDEAPLLSDHQLNQKCKLFDLITYRLATATPLG